MSTAPDTVARDALSAAIAEVCARLERDLDGVGALALPAPPAGSTLEKVSRAFELDAFELGVLLVGAALELQPGVDGLCADRNGSSERPWPTIKMLISCLPDARWDAFLPTAPLRAHRLVRLGAGDVLTERPVLLEERVLHALMGRAYLDPRLERRVSPVVAPSALAACHVVAAERLVRLWGAGPVHVWCQEPGVGAAVVARAAQDLGREALRLPARAVPTDPEELDQLLSLWSREERLQPLALLVDLDDASDATSERVARDYAARATGVVASVGHEPRSGETISRVRVEPASFDERIESWRTALGELPEPEGLDEIVARFHLGPEGVEATVDALRSGLSRAPNASPRQLVWEGAKVQAQPGLEDLAQRVALHASFDELVLPASQERVLRAILGQVRRKAVVEHGWGFALNGSLGAGVSALFAGASGTGKTMAAEVLAGALELDLYRVDLSAVVSKYIGETEKNLRRIFDGAEAGGAVLLFDEADALFGKRTQVNDSHDRHANIEVSYLLQRMESYGGLAILTTNHRDHLDEAFLRRIPFVVEFPFPDASDRERIWRGIFPDRAPLEDVSFTALARMSVPGGNIRSIARNAAFLAADRESPLTMAILREAAEIEYGKLGRVLSSSEVRGWK